MATHRNGFCERGNFMTKVRISLNDFKRDRTLSQHIQKSKQVARALDAKNPTLPYARTFNCYEFEDFLSQLTPKRFELLRLASKGGRSIADLAIASKRDPSAVSKDVARLSKLGLVRVDAVPNDGHGQKKIVTPVATTISINASIALA
jgi:predicted transcriptional regulator